MPPTSRSRAPYDAVIGLEVHAQLLTHTKIFCGCSADFGAAPNTRVCPVCLGLPGALPVLNAGAVRLAVRASLALGAEVQRRSVFARKNYFYADLPKGYQISQFDLPLALSGHLDIDSDGASDGGASTQKPKRVRIQRVHMEEDAGKNVHDKGDRSVVDLNRAGVPLIEIVSEPDLSSAHEAGAYLRALREILVFAGVNDGNLEEGSFRCDANVSIKPTGATELGTRVELKNINSFKFVEKAISHEIARQEALLDTGGKVVRETRGWDAERETSYTLRNKEAAEDYRYFPDPDLPPLVVDDAFLEEERRTLPELPKEKRARFVAELALPDAAAAVLTSHPRLAAYFEEAAMLASDAVPVANFIQSEIMRDVEIKGLAATFPISASQLASLLSLAKSGAISGKQAKELYAKLKGTTRDPKDLVKELGMSQLTDVRTLEVECKAILDANEKQVAQYRAGKTALFGFFVGEVMKRTKGRANPAVVNETLKRLLESS
jgi:aspartyl-tRNA(Asn)/glutamyl-tRNA(Gln) amidotransferase subunit B